MAESLRSEKSTSETKMMPLSVEAMPAIMLKPAANEVEATSGRVRITASASSMAACVTGSAEASGVETITMT